MIAVDTNILVYAHRSEFPQHRAAIDALRRLVDGRQPWGVPVFSCGEFIRVATHRGVLAPPSSVEVAVMSLDALLSSPTAVLLHPGDRFWGLLASAVMEGAAGGNLVFDAQIVALCREHGIDTILTEDRDFGRFAGFNTMRLGGA